MKVLLDENIPERFWRRLGTHEAMTVAYMGWRTYKNGELLKRAEQQGFQVFVTGDQNLSYQQNMTERQIALIVLNTNDRRLIENKLEVIAQAISNAAAGSFKKINCTE